MAEYLFQEGKLDNVVHDITYKQIKQLYLDNKHEEREGKRITESSYRGENYYGNYNNLYFAMQQEYLLRDPKTAGMRMYYPHGVVIEQSMRRNYYRGENQIYKESTPTLHRSLKKFSSKKEQELYRMVADMRIAEFETFLKKFQHVSNWKISDVLYDALAQQYGMLFHMPSSTMVSRWSMNFGKFQIWTNKVIGKTEDGREQYERLEYPPYRGLMDNLIYPLGFQPFMRCHMQNGYGIYMRTSRPLQSDIGFEKLRFRHNEKLSRDVYEMMEGGELIYPHEGLKETEFIIDQIKQLTVFSEEAFIKALYRNHYYRLDDVELMKEKNFIPHSVIELEAFVDKHFRIGFRGDRKKIIALLQELYPDGIVDFEPIRSWIVSRYDIGCEYREKSKCFISLILSAEEKEQFDLWEQMMKDFGCPNVINKKGQLSSGAYLNNRQVDIGYMLAPIAINELIKIPNDKVQSCALTKICRAFTDESAYDGLCESNARKKADAQWLCSLGVFLNLYHLV